MQKKDCNLGKTETVGAMANFCNKETDNIQPPISGNLDINNEHSSLTTVMGLDEGIGELPKETTNMAKGPSYKDVVTKGETKEVFFGDDIEIWSDYGSNGEDMMEGAVGSQHIDMNSNPLKEDLIMPEINFSRDMKESVRWSLMFCAGSIY